MEVLGHTFDKSYDGSWNTEFQGVKLSLWNSGDVWGARVTGPETPRWSDRLNGCSAGHSTPLLALHDAIDSYEDDLTHVVVVYEDEKRARRASKYKNLR